VPHSVESPRQSSRPHRSSRPPERALAPECEPPLGAHMVTPRLGYTHHGIYAGQGRIVQYGGLSRGLRRGPVEEVSLVEFCQGHPIRVRLEESCWRDPTAVVRRARLRLGENRYHPLRNNCEHFCEWCVRGEHRSYQVEELVGRCVRMWHQLIETAGRALLRRRQVAANSCADRGVEGSL
jgi:Lecithin retinol acyltransferase